MKTKIPFADLRVRDEVEQRELQEALKNVLSHGQLILGPEVSALEEEIASLCARRFAVGVASGTSAIVLALRALEIGPRDRVITSALSWLASGTSISLTGAEPVFADVRQDFNMDPDSLKRFIGPNCKAILPVNYGGKICEFERIIEIADTANIPVIEDASQSIGALRRAQPAGSFGKISIISLNPMKGFGALGEAGIILTDDARLNDRMRALRYHGMPDKERSYYFSGNERIDTLQAAFLLCRLSKLENLLEARQRIAEQYDLALKYIVKTPKFTTTKDSRDAWFTYPILTKDRDALTAYLSSMGIESRRRETIALPDQPVFSQLPPSHTPIARRLVDQMLFLPIHEKLSDTDVRYVIDSIRTFFSCKSK